MKQILFSKVIPLITNAALVLFALFFYGKSETWGVFLLGLVILSSIVPFWRYLAKVQTIEITDKRVIINGLVINRSNVLSWRFFHASSYGVRGRHIELKLAKLPSSTWAWRLVKLFERAPTLNMVERRVPLAREPKIIVALKFWDAKESEITQALESSTSELLNDDKKLT